MTTNPAATAERATPGNATRPVGEINPERAELRQGRNTMTTEPTDYSKQVRSKGSGSLPPINHLQTGEALLRRIAYSADMTRIMLGWLLGITVAGIIAAVIVGAILIAHTPTPVSTPAACDSTVSTC